MPAVDQDVKKPREKVLLLGGTADARLIADHLAKQPDIEAELSLAGVLSQPPKMALPLRIGGFGGVDGLVRYIHDHGITVLIDATHPYAAQMSYHAVMACQRTGIRRFSLWRPPWEAEDDDHWQGFDDWPQLMAAIPEGARVFMAAGQDGMKALPPVPKFSVLARALARPEGLPDHVEMIEDLPGKTPEAEMEIFTNHGISHIICKNSGGTSSQAKLIAARKLGLPVLMINRPSAPPAPIYPDAESLLAALFDDQSRGV